ncbi:hypothetical protein KEM56_000057, partial [Ascosphaera pollenicola]
MPQIPAWQRESSQPTQDTRTQEKPDQATNSAAEPSATAETSTGKSASETQAKTQLSNDGDDGSTKETREALLESARKWLADDSIKDTSTSDKISFLEQKGLDAEDVKSLLGLAGNDAAMTNRASSQEKSLSSLAPAAPAPAPAPTTSAPPPPPIITYPEFLSTPNHQPPLLTLPALLGTVYGVT